MNSSGHYGLYQFSASTWAAYGGNPADFGNASVAEQNQVFDNAIAAGGQSNWAPYDGCPVTLALFPPRATGRWWQAALTRGLPPSRIRGPLLAEHAVEQRSPAIVVPEARTVSASTVLVQEPFQGLELPSIHDGRSPLTLQPQSIPVEGLA